MDMKIILKKAKREVRFYVRDIIINSIAGSNFMPIFLRKQIYRIYGIKVGARVIRSKCFFGNSKVEIGKGTFINYNCFFEGTSKVVIGKNCALGMNVTFCNSNHEMSKSEKRAGAISSKPIIVGDGVWIGANVVILPGVTIGNGCVIAAGAVVNKDCEANGLYGGNPIRKIRDLN